MQLRSRSRAMDAREPCQAGNRAAFSGIFHVPRGCRFRSCIRRTVFAMQTHCKMCSCALSPPLGATGKDVKLSRAAGTAGVRGALHCARSLVWRWHCVPGPLPQMAAQDVLGRHRPVPHHPDPEKAGGGGPHLPRISLYRHPGHRQDHLRQDPGQGRQL